MRDLLRVSDIRYIAAARADKENGTHGWVSFVVDRTLRVDGVAVRRPRDSVWSLSCSDRRGRSCVAQSVVLPIKQATRAATIEQGIAYQQHGARVPC